MDGLWIPEEILRIEELDFLSKGLLSQIVALSEKNHCYASNTYFSKLFGVTTRTISSSLSNLEQLKLIESKIDKANGNSRTIKVLEKYSRGSVHFSIPIENSSKGIEKSSTGMENNSTGSENSSIPIEKSSSQYKDESKVENKLKTNLKQSSNDDFQKNENLATDENLEIVEQVEIIDFKGTTKKAPQTGGAGRETEFPFDVIWGMYGRKGSAKVAKQRYDKLSEMVRETIFEHVPNYVQATPEIQFRKNFEVYLNKESYNDQIIKQNANSTNSTNRGFKNETGDEYLKRVGGELNEIFEYKFGRGGNGLADELSNVSDGNSSVSLF